MADESRAHAQPVPEVLAHLVQLNVDFQVLVCLGEECRCVGEIFNGFEVESNIAYLNELKCTFD